MLSEPIEVTAALASVLKELGVRYFVGGSLASSLHGIPRATADVDIVADLWGDHVELLVEKLQGDFYIAEEAVRGAVARKDSFNVIHLATMLKIDIFVFKG